MILDTFVYLFESDASGLQEGLKKSEAEAKKLEKGVKDADSASSKLGQSFSDMIATAGGALAAIFSVGAMANGIVSAAAYADQVGKLSDALGVNIGDLDAWGQAVKRSGGSIEGFQASVGSLTQRLSEISVKGTGESLDFFKNLGISVFDATGKVKNAMDILPELAEKMEGISKAEAMGIGRKLGLDQGTIMLLQQGKVSVEALVKRQKELGVATKESFEISAKFNDAMDDTKQVFNALFMVMGQKILPAITWVLEGMQGLGVWMRQNSDFMVGLFIALGTAITAYALPALVKMGIAAFAAFSPFLMIGAVIAGISIAFALLYDDILAFVEGGQSAFGDLLEWMGYTSEEVEAIRQAIANFGEMAISVFEAIANAILHPIETIKKLLGLFSEIGGFAGIFSSIGGLLGIGNQQIAQANATPLNSVSSTAISNMGDRSSTSNVLVQKVEVNTSATDANGISRDIGGSLQDQLRQATANADDAIAY